MVDSLLQSIFRVLYKNFPLGFSETQMFLHNQKVQIKYVEKFAEASALKRTFALITTSH